MDLFIFHPDSHAVHSFTRKMHGSVRSDRRAHHKARKNAGSKDSELEEETNGEMDNFQDLQLGSITPVVRHEDDSLLPSLT